MNTVIVSTCMDRNAFLLKSLPSWLALEMPIVLVDWSSKVPLRDSLGEHLRRVTLVEVSGKDSYDTSASRNLAFRAAQREFPAASHIFHLDADVIIKDPDYFLGGLEIAEDCYHRGTFRYPVPGLSKVMRYLSRLERFKTLTNCCLFGTFLAPVSLVNKVNGYDERMQGYGISDTEFYVRLRRLGNVREYNLRSRALYHQPHANRSANFLEKDREVSMRENKRIAAASPWGVQFQQAKQECRVNGRPAIV